MEENVVKHEKQSLDFPPKSPNASRNIGVIDLSSSDSDSDVDCEDGGNAASDAKRSRVSDEEGSSKKRKSDFMAVSLPPGFLDPLPPREPLALPKPEPRPESDMEPIRMLPPKVGIPGCKQFWKAGDYEGDLVANSALSWASAGMDHVRVHPKFLHSNATSHKWALGAFAELLDNSLDEVCSGATYVNIDMLENKKDKSKMLLVEDNGGGMDPDKMRQCMSLGYSAKSKLANTIGQYGNGFKTSTMRLGADVIVFSRCHGKDRKSPTQSIGLLSYTYLRSTRKEDIVVPMLDYEKAGKVWKNMSRLSPVDWNINVETIVHWSPFSSEAELLQQFTSMEDQGTRIIIYNLWEDDQGDLELDFCADRHDIQIRGVNRDPKKIQMAQKFPNSKHFLTYRHSLRNYVSILYLRLPVGFRIILRGKDVQHHDIVNDMMLIQEITYRPQPSSNGIPKESNMVAVVTIGFVKDAKDHIDVQGFNVYHKNRLIKPFWRLWNSTGSDGRGVIGVLEANFVEPAHDKQGFERTTVLQRLESRLIQMQKTYWSNNCHRIGYAPRRIKEVLKDQTSDSPKSRTFKKKDSKHVNGHRTNGVENGSRYGSKLNSSESTSEDESDQDFPCENSLNKGSSSRKESTPQNSSHKESSYIPCSLSHSEKEHQVSEGETKTVASGTFLKSSTSNRNGATVSHSDGESLKQLEAENCQLKERLKMEESELLTLQSERDRSKSLQAQIHELERKIEEARKEQEALIDIFSEERSRRDKEEAALRKKLKDAHTTIQDLTQKLRLSSINIKPEP